MPAASLLALIIKVLTTPEVIITALAFIVLSLLASYIAHPPPKRKLPLFAPRPKREKAAKPAPSPAEEEDEEEE